MSKGRSAIPTPQLPLVVPFAPEPHPIPDEQRASALQALQETMRGCRLCVAGGHLARAESVAGYRGRVTDRVMLIGQAPGHVSVERGLPFSGPGGRILQVWLVRAGFAAEDFRQRVYISALTRCDPGPNPRGSGDRKPSFAELALCRPYVLRELELVRPRIILAVGGMAIAAFLGPRRLEDVIGTSVERNGAHVVPLPHPSGVSRWLNDPDHQALLARALARLAALRVEMDRPADAQPGEEASAKHVPLPIVAQ
jgi:uracil-DNA glycosylase family 4